MRDLAVPLPLLVIAEMMGVPEADRPYIRTLAEKLLYNNRGEPDRYRTLMEGVNGMFEYCDPLLDERKENPWRRLHLGAGQRREGRSVQPGPTRCPTPRCCLLPATRPPST